ncbi:ATP-binding protein [Bradyrhizobium sp. ARR65]|uniref:ATP-binding protein n=1 Tax=Bradyrhizobium sp. ARR65 TaxID=1040989 RepID=UPI0004678445|nr:ATP-binding protein [Bradyrhizobium sp. ARR65]
MALLSRLFLLVAVALVPTIAIQLYNEFDFSRSRQIEVQEEATGLAKIAAAQQEEIVQGIHQVLIALSELPAIKTRQPEACSSYLSTIKRSFPAFLTFVAVDMNGAAFCATHGEVVNVAGRTYFAKATRTGKFTVGEFSIGLSTGRQVIQFALPFYGDQGGMAGIIIATLSLDWLGQFIAQMDVPPGTAMAIADRNGTYLARHPNGDRFVGRKMPLERYPRGEHWSTNDTRDIDGVERIVGHAALPDESGGLLVSVALDKAQAFASIHRRTRRGILLIALSTSLALMLTWLGARRFIRHPLQLLANAADRWRLGDYTPRVQIQDNRSEIAAVAHAFNSMADALEQRERELSGAKEAAEEAAARITTIFESTADCVLILDRDWHITYLNEHAKAHFADERNLVGMDFWQALSDFIEGDLSDRLREAMSEQHLARFEIFCHYRAQWYEVNAFPSGEGLAVQFRDITEQRHAIKARRQMEDQLHQSQKMEAVGQLTGGVAHDFNNLLMVITGNLELIEERAGDNDSIRQLAASARNAAYRGASLTTQLLAFSRRQKLNPKPIYVGHLVRDFQELIRRALGESCELKLIIDDQLWPCQVDPAQLETALLNLILNGRDAMPNGGTLQIEARNVHMEENAVTGIASGSYVRISVSDTGCGMSPETLDRVFEPFFTTKDIGSGTGLGLSMVYGFVRQSCGHVAIESALGAGTTVSLYLPRSSQTPDTETEIAPSQDAPPGSGRVLVVEDDDDVLDVTSAMLRKLGYQVLCARNGIDAIRLLKDDKKFDLLFTDVVMPQGINGVELAREAKRLCAGIKILLTSGNAADVLARYGAVDEFTIIGKPFRRAELAHYLQLVMHDA